MIIMIIIITTTVLYASGTLGRRLEAGVPSAESTDSEEAQEPEQARSGTRSLAA